MQEKRLDERFDVAVHHGLHVGHLGLGAVVVDHGVGLEDVGADLASPLDLFLLRLHLVLLRLLDLAVLPAACKTQQVGIEQHRLAVVA